MAATMALVWTVVGGSSRMFGRRDGDFNARRFWSWFASEAPGLANSIEALARGEDDAEWALIGLNERIRRYDPALEADVVRSDRKSTRLNSSHSSISYAVFCLKKKNRKSGS